MRKQIYFVYGIYEDDKIEGLFNVQSFSGKFITETSPSDNYFLDEVKKFFIKNSNGKFNENGNLTIKSLSLIGEIDELK